MTMDADAVFIDTNILIYATDDQSPFHEKALKMFNWIEILALENV